MDQNKPTFDNNVKDPSNIKPQNNIFEATNYFTSFHQQKQHAKELDIVLPIPPRLSSSSSSMETISSYRARSFNTTPTTSSEASWNSQAGLLTNSSGSVGSAGISMNNKVFPNESNVNSKWLRISTKWLNRKTKCPCVGKKSVQVDERVHSSTMPKMVDLRRSASYNGCKSLYSPRQSSPKTLGTNVPNEINNNNDNNNDNDNRNNNDQSKVNKGGGDHTINNVVTVTTTATTTTTVVDTVVTNMNNSEFTFPILENRPVGLKKIMFNVIPPSHHRNNEDPNPDSLEVFHLRNHSSPMSRRMSYEDENVMSDGSSDLFEIESLISTMSYPCRDSIDEVITVPNSNISGTMKRHGISDCNLTNQLTSSHL